MRPLTGPLGQETPALKPAKALCPKGHLEILSVMTERSDPSHHLANPDFPLHPNTHTDLKPHLTSRSAQRAHALQAWRRPTGPPLLGPVCLYPFCKTAPPHPPPSVSLTHPPVWAGSPPAPSLRAALSLPPPSGPSHSTRLEGF